MSNIRRINAFKCTMWRMHDRLGDHIDVSSCASLIDSMRRQGQKHAVLGRMMNRQGEFEVELIYGARRLFAAQHLGLDLLVDIREIDDRAALAEMDIENRVRSDITAYERGLSYMRWLRSGYFESQTGIAKALGVSEAQVSRLLRYAELPSVVVSAFRRPQDIREEWAVALAKCCRDSEARSDLMRRSRELAKSSAARSPQHVFDRLMNGGQVKYVRQQSHDQVVKSRRGSPLFRVGVRARSVHLIFARDKLTPATLEQLTELVRGTLECDSENEPAPVRSPALRPVHGDGVRTADAFQEKLRSQAAAGC